MPKELKEKYLLVFNKTGFLTEQLHANDCAIAEQNDKESTHLVQRLAQAWGIA